MACKCEEMCSTCKEMTAFEDPRPQLRPVPKTVDELQPSELDEVLRNISRPRVLVDDVIAEA